MTTFAQAHADSCRECQEQVASPEPYRDERCHTRIGPDKQPVQCPHPRDLSSSAAEAPGCCQHHIEWMANIIIRYRAANN